MRYILSLALLALLWASSCKPTPKDLPYIGEKTEVNGEIKNYQIPHWTYTDQDGNPFTDKDLSEYIYVTDFFFISCPSICPMVMKQMKRIYEAYKDDPRVKIVSFTIDPKRDTPEKLKEYSRKLNVDNEKWIFLTGEKEATFDLANTYFIAALEDPDAPGGFDHSGKIILIDKERHVRSFSEGTEAEETPRLIRDMKILLDSYEK